jgi:hypothetical protein
MGYVRNMGRSGSSWHGAGGRFAKAPSLEDAGLVGVCSSCNGFVVKEFPSPEETDPVARRGTWPKTCPQCGEERTSS